MKMCEIFTLWPAFSAEICTKSIAPSRRKKSKSLALTRRRLYFVMCALCFCCPYCVFVYFDAVFFFVLSFGIFTFFVIFVVVLFRLLWSCSFVLFFCSRFLPCCRFFFVTEPIIAFELVFFCVIWLSWSCSFVCFLVANSYPAVAFFCLSRNTSLHLNSLFLCYLVIIFIVISIFPFVSFVCVAAFVFVTEPICGEHGTQVTTMPHIICSLVTTIWQRPHPRLGSRQIRAD